MLTRCFIGAPGAIRTPDPLVRRIESDISIYINQSLTSVRHTQKQYKPATESPNKRHSGTVFTTAHRLLTLNL